MSKKWRAITAAVVLAIFLMGSGTTVNDVGGTVYHIAFLVAGADTLFTAYELRALGFTQVTKIGIKSDISGVNTLTTMLRNKTIKTTNYPLSADDVWEISLRKISDAIRQYPDSSAREDTIVAYTSAAGTNGTWIFLWGF